MHLSTVAAFLSTVLAVSCIFPYVIAILKGKTKPHQLSWLVFLIMNGIVFGSQFLVGGRGSTLIALAFTVGSLIIYLLSFKYGARDTSKWDKQLFSFAVLTIIIWVLTRSNETAIWLTVLIDIIATAMIILKLKTQPNSEAALPWLLGTVAYLFSCVSLIGTPLNILYVRPIYGFLCDGLLVLAILLYQKPSTKIPTISPAEI